MEKKLELKTQWGTTEQVGIEINTYLNNGNMYIGLTTDGDGYPEPYGDVTVNLGEKVPDFCGYIDTNNMPELEKFLVDNDIGEFTGFMQRSGFCVYPMYMFNVDKLRELCPDGMEAYEMSKGYGKKQEDKVLSK